MNWNELIRAVANRTEMDPKLVRSVLDSFSAVAVEQLSEGESVTLRNVGALSSAWREPRSLRSIADHRTIRLDGRFVPRFRPSEPLRRALGARTPQRSRSPEHQEAWRVAETLIDDLELYHSADAPRGMAVDTDSETVHVACTIAFGSLWKQVTQTYESEVPEEIRMQHDYLAEAALRRWQQ